MTPAQHPNDESSQYEFRIRDRLERRWETWFDDLTVIHEDDHTTTLRGEIADQSALHGVLARLRDLGLTLVSVRKVELMPDRQEPA